MEQGNRRVRVTAVVGLLTVFLGLTVGYPWWTGHQADRAQTTLYDSLRAAYAGTTSESIDGLFVESFSAGDGGRFEDFFTRADGRKPDAIGAVDGGRGYQARYDTVVSGQRRCVVATWRIDGFTLERGAGSACRAASGD